MKFIYGLLNKGELLLQSLGKWVADSHQIWIWHIDQVHEVVHKQSDEQGVEVYARMPSVPATQSKQYQRTCNHDRLASGTCKVSIIYEGKGWVEVDGGIQERDLPHCTAFSYWTREWGASKIFENIVLPANNLEGFTSEVEANMVISYSDGLFRPELSISLSTNGWKMKSLTSDQEVECAVLTLGPGGSSHRAESQETLSMASSSGYYSRCLGLGAMKSNLVVKMTV